MPRPRALDLPAHGSSMPKKKNIRSPRVVASPLLKQGNLQQQQYVMKFISRKIAHGTNKSKLVIHALRRRLLRRGLNSPRTPRTTFASTSPGPSHPDDHEFKGTLPAILLPQLPLLDLPYLFPETTDSGYCSDASLSSGSSSSQSEAPKRPARRYILPDLWDPLAVSPCDLVSTEIRVRLSAQPTSPTLPPLRFEPFKL